jgi:hypothetical protein
MNRLFSLLFTLFFCGLTFSQIIIHIDYDKHNPQREGFSGNVDLSMSMNQAVNFVFGTNNGSQIFYSKGKYVLKSLNGLNLTVVNKNLPINDGFQHFRYSYNATDRVIPEVFVQGQYNHNTKVAARYIFGIGGLFKIYNKETDSMQLHIGFHFMPEYERELLGQINRHQRFNTMVSWGYTFDNNLKLDLVTYLQPDIKRLSDFRIMGNLAVELPLTEKLTYRSSFGWVFDTHPPEGLRPNFFNTRNGLRYVF